MIFLGKNFAGATFKKGENIDQFLLEYCNKTLTEVVTPTDCNIRNYFFREQRNLQKITFGDGCTKLDYGVCQNCTSLYEVYIPNSVTTIESDAFYGCSGIHFIIDAETSSISGYPWGATDCTVEWLRGGDAPVGDFIFYNDYNTMEQSSQQSNGWHGFVFNPSLTPCVNPEALEYLYSGRAVTGIDIMLNPYARDGEAQRPVYVQVYENINGLSKMTSSENNAIIYRGNFDEFVHFDFINPIYIQPDGKYQLEFTLNPQNQVNQISPATFNMDVFDPTCGCYWLNTNNLTPTDMVAFKLIFE